MRQANLGFDRDFIEEWGVFDEVDTSDSGIDRLPRAEEIAVTGRGTLLTCVGSQAQISAMVSEAEANGIDVRLERLHDYRTRETVLETLTPRQREVLEVAFARGYYDVPRRAATAEIAAELGLDDSTISEHLQRAEHNTIRTLLS